MASKTFLITALLASLAAFSIIIYYASTASLPYQQFRHGVITTWSTTIGSTVLTTSTTINWQTTLPTTSINCGQAFCWPGVNAPNASTCPSGCKITIVGTCGFANQYQCTSSTIPSTTTTNTTSTSTSTAISRTTTIPSFYVYVSAVPISCGTLTPPSGNYLLGTKLILNITAQRYTFVNWTGTGKYSYTGNNKTATISVYSNITETAHCR